MSEKYSPSWKSSKNAGKQRLYRRNAPLHIKRKFLSCHLSAELRKKHSIRAIGAKKGDKVKIMVGKFKGHTGKIEAVELKFSKIIVENTEITKRDGNKIKMRFDPSNLMITALVSDDKKRLKNKKPVTGEK